MFEQLGLIGCGLMGGSFAWPEKGRLVNAWSATASRPPPPTARASWA